MFDRSQSTVAKVDPEIWAAIQAENRRQEEHIELIASENYTSPAVMASIPASSPARMRSPSGTLVSNARHGRKSPVAVRRKPKKQVLTLGIM